MMFTQKNLMTVCCAAVLAFGLAACGSSSDDDNVAVTTPMMDGDGDAMDGDGDGDAMPVAVACATSATSQGCVDEKKAALDAATKAQETLKADENSTQKQLTEAQDAVDAAQEAYDDAMTVRNTYLAMQPPMYDPEAVATAFDKVSETLEGGLTVANADTDTVRGGKVTVNADGDNTYAKATWPVPKITGWAGSVWERSNSPMDSVVVYTNVQDAANAKYNTYYTGGQEAPAVTDAQAGWRYKAWAGVTSVAVNTVPTKPNVITLEGSVTDATRSLFDFAHGLTGPNQTNDFVDDGDTTVDEAMPKIMGKFNGVAGTFACMSGCMLKSDGDGKLLTFVGGWTFTADSNAMVAGVLVDADYLDFGYWVNTDDSGDDTVYMVNTFFRGEVLSGDVTALEGSATYKGGATGLYTKRALTPGGDGDVTAAGRFTADAELKAYFGGGDVSANNEDTISGTIKNFMDGDNVVDAGWSVELMQAETETGVFSGDATGGGSWSGTLYGEVEGDSDNVTDGMQSTLPSGVAGEFTAGFNNGDLIGSFGATKTK